MEKVTVDTRFGVVKVVFEQFFRLSRYEMLEKAYKEIAREMIREKSKDK